ncbi:MAG TPA: hypothetical protein PLL10_09705, partial [Elusimicrobiales bacterium]|nr:hypothetical protein [Elusimicrobiales bacterium]
PSRLVKQHELEKLRGLVLERVRWFASVKPGSAESARLKEQALSLLRARRRGMMKFIYTAPRFGDRGGGVSWHKHLEQLNAECGFRIDLSLLPVIDALISRVARGENIWPELVRRFRLSETPFCVCARPEPALLARQKREKLRRVADLERGLKKAYKTATVQQALELKHKDSSAVMRELEQRDKGIAKPHFVKAPPLTLDDNIKAARARLRGGPSALLNDAGDSPFVDVGLYFSINGLGRKELALLPLLPSALSAVGVRTPDGRELDYVRMLEELRSEIYSLRCGMVANPWSARLELSLKASCCGSGELESLFKWLENCLFRTLLEPKSRARLVDIVNEGIQQNRTIMSGREEDWVRDAAGAFIHSDKPDYLAVRGPFTELFLLERLRWRLENPPEKELLLLRASLKRLARVATAAGKAEFK